MRHCLFLLFPALRIIIAGSLLRCPLLLGPERRARMQFVGQSFQFGFEFGVPLGKRIQRFRDPPSRTIIHPFT